MTTGGSNVTRILWPGGRVPVSVLLDDPTPCRNPMWYEFPSAGHVKEVPNSFTERFAGVIARSGARGKFSVVPCPGGQGRLDEGVPDLPAEEMHAWLKIVNDRISPTWSVGPEMITHNRAYDMKTGGLQDDREDAWGSRQDASTLTPYISLALTILRNVGLEPSGVTSPWSFGIEVEDAYNTATAAALREVCGVLVGWYFLHVDSASGAVPPRVRRLDVERRTSLISLVSCSRDAAGHADFAWMTQFGGDAVTDSVLTRDGTGGRLAELFPAGEPMIFHTHWQSMFSNGRGTGLDGLEEVFNRINGLWGERIIWMSARELALYTTARAATTIERTPDGQGIQVHAPFACSEFTIRTTSTAPVAHVEVNGRPLDEARPDETLHEGAWKADGSDIVACFRLADGDVLTWS
jgi:hypothetical protein